MPSLRKRVTSYFRQLSFHNEPRERRLNVNENSFVTKYLHGQIKLKDGPTIISGKSPSDLPSYDLETYRTGPDTVVGCYTGPNGGLTTVKRTEKHLSVADADIDFIDTQDENGSATTAVKISPNRSGGIPIDNTSMVIKVAGREYFVTNRKKHRNKSHSLGSISDFNVEIETTKIIAKSCEEPVERHKVTTAARKSSSYGISKSKSEGNPFQHKKRGKIIRVQRPSGTAAAATDTNEPSLPDEWCSKSDYVYGLSDSLYDRNQITRTKNGDPIADCFGIIARCDSAVLAVADGVNWGEKACIAAKSAIHGCLHYLNRTVFNDTKPFESLVKSDVTNKSETPLHNARVANTREVFVCLLRAFNCAHDLILENNGMLTTLTVAVVLPLKRSGEPTSYVCCVCNVGDTLAYVYSQKHGMRELTKGSHDVNLNRDMRDALGALGPVDGINPELSNLTLSVTTVQRGDIIFVASDGLTDNFDPNVCKFTVNTNLNDPIKLKKQHAQKTAAASSRRSESSRPPVKPPRRHRVKTASEESAGDITKTIREMSKIVNKTSEQSESVVGNSNKPLNSTVHLVSNLSTSFKQDLSNPLVAQFVRDNSVDDSDSYAKCRRSLLENKPPTTNNFSRSKTSLDLRPKTIARNEDGLPYVTPIQRYELTLLLMEDVLRHGISGRDSECVTARKLCESLLNFTFSITSAKRHTLEDNDLYFDTQNGLLVEVSSQEKKVRRKRGLERVQTLPGKLDHVTVVAFNVGNCASV